MKFASLFTGVGMFDAALESVGAKCVLQCEIDARCRSVLERHWPKVERYEDVNDKRTEESLCRLRPKLIAFGSPCQDLSVAGKRDGLAGERSGLFYRGVELCLACQADWVLWENVPVVLSSHRGADFASVIEAFTGVRYSVPKKGWQDSGVAIGPVYSIAWAVLDAQWFGVPQRRKRIFIVGHLSSRSGPYEVLALGESLPWNTPPSREEGQGIARCLANGSNPGRWDGESENFIAATLSAGVHSGRRREDDFNLVTAPLTGSPFADNASQESKLVYQCHGSNVGEFGTLKGDSVGNGIPFVAHSLRGEGFDASEDGSGWGVPLIPFDTTQITSHGNYSAPKSGDPCHPISHGSHAPAIAFAIHEKADTDRLNGIGFNTQTAYTLEARHHGQSVAGNFGVRRLMPIECERLMGMDDRHTARDSTGKKLSDSARYRMCGNGVVVNVVRWIGGRIIEINHKK